MKTVKDRVRELEYELEDAEKEHEQKLAKKAKETERLSEKLYLLEQRANNAAVADGLQSELRSARD